MDIRLNPIAYVESDRKNSEDDNWAQFISTIRLIESIPAEAFKGIETFSHLQIIYYFHRVGQKTPYKWSRSPRNNPEWPEVGIFCQRNKNRPNLVGISYVELLECNGKELRVKYLDAIDSTPILDIKPVFKDFQPKGEIREPKWTAELLKNYW